MEEEELVLVAEKTIWPWEERLVNAGAGPFQCTRANPNMLLNCCKFIRPTVLLTKRQTLIFLCHFL